MVWRDDTSCGGGGSGGWCCGVAENDGMIGGAESVQLSAIFVVVQIVFEKELAHLEEGCPGEERVAAGLVLRT